MLSRLGVSIWPLLFHLARAGLANVTIDDSSADPRTGNSIVYDPPTTWNSQAGCQQGPICLAQPDKSIIFDGTWHESSFFPTDSHPITASFEFDGTAVYVYCVIPISIAPSGNSDMTFSIDGQVSGTYIHGPPGITGGYKYDTLVFSNSALSPGSHKLDITNGRLGTSLAPAGMILDRIVYSFEVDSPAAFPSLGLPPPLRSSSPLSTAAANPSASESPSDSAGSALTTEIPGIGSSSRAGSPATSSGPFESASSGHSESTSSLDLSSSTNPTSSTGEVLPADPSLTANPSPPSGSPSPKSSKHPIGSIIGAVLGALFTVLVIIIILLLCRRRRRQARVAAMLASKTSEIQEVDLRDSFHRNSFYTSTPIDPFGPVQLPSPTQSRRPFTFRSVASPANSPTSPGGVDPYPVFGDRNAPANMRHLSQGWMVGSDSKRALLDASTAPPPLALSTNSPMRPGEVDPYLVFDARNAPANMRHTGKGWSVGSDSKKALLDADGALPPGYYD